jgi:FTR1 family protein
MPPSSTTRRAVPASTRRAVPASTRRAIPASTRRTVHRAAATSNPGAALASIPYGALTSIRRAGLAVLLALAVVCGLSASPAQAGSRPDTLTPAQQRAAAGQLLAQLSLEYSQGFISHNPVAAAHARGMAAAAQTLAAQGLAGTPAALGATATRGTTATPGATGTQGTTATPGATGTQGTTATSGTAAARATAAQLVRTLGATTFALQIWPEPTAVSGLVKRLARQLSLGATLPDPDVKAALAAASQLAATAASDASAGRRPTARAVLAETYATFARTLATRLGAVAPEQVSNTETEIWRGINAGTSPALARAAASVVSDLHDDAASLGQVTVSRGTIVTDAAIILFREGLEAVLILAAITASFTGARRRLRRLVLIGAGLGLLATAVTYVLAQVIIDALGDGGLRLQAITGILAIVVLLIVTNWFFHRVYWSEWISRFNRRRKALEKVEKFGFISGQALGFLILGLTSVYREGFETVLFLQNLQVSAGTGATLLGVAIGLGATLIVGIITFALGRKLPYKKMLILTGVLIGLVLAVMVGTTVNNMQGLGWIPSNAAGFTVSTKLSQWTGVYPTWEGVGAQVTALLVVYGSYAVARQIQDLRRRRAIALTSDAVTS